MLYSLIEGTITTLAVSSASVAAGVPLGLCLALLRLSRVPVLKQCIAAYVSLIRAMPTVTLALFIFFGVPSLGIPLSPFVAGLLTICINTSAFQSEIWRAAIADFPRNQVEAAAAFGMSRQQTFRRVVLPQVWRASLPALFNETTFIIKSSPAIAVIGVVDLTRAASRVSAYTYEPILPYLCAAAIYATVVFILVTAQRQIERRIVIKYGVL